MLSLTYVIASAFVVFNVKARIVQEKCWQAEIMGVLELITMHAEHAPADACM